VLVSSKLPGSVTVTVVTDAQGRYSFPASKLQAGHQIISVRAVGYDLVGRNDVIITPSRTITMDLTLTKARDVASQLSKSQWLASFPGAEQQKASVRACTHCHTLERIARSHYDAEKL